VIGIKQQSPIATASDKVYQLLAHGRWFSPGTLASSTTKTGRNDIAETLLKVVLNTNNLIKSNQKSPTHYISSWCTKFRGLIGETTTIGIQRIIINSQSHQ
jgi:hypothetical protein